jgi:hypothetical protein
MRAQARLLLLATMVSSLAAIGPLAAADTSTGGSATSVAPLKKAKPKPRPHATGTGKYETTQVQKTFRKIETPSVGGKKNSLKDNWQAGH